MNSLRSAAQVFFICLLLVVLHMGALVALVHYFDFKFFFGSIVLWQLCGSLGISVCYHRQLTHRAFSTSKLVKLFHLIIAGIAGQQGPLSWARVHRAHHAHSDQELDPHSPRQGFAQAHFGWLFQKERRKKIPEMQSLLEDLSSDPIVVFFEKYNLVLFGGSLVSIYAIGGTKGLCWFGFFRLTLTLHSAWLVNSVGHSWGYRNFSTADQSRNNFWLALISGGEGYHNNHHRYPYSARVGLRAQEFDLGWVYIRCLEKLSWASQVRSAPAILMEQSNVRTLA